MGTWVARVARTRGESRSRRRQKRGAPPILEMCVRSRASSSSSSSFWPGLALGFADSSCSFPLLDLLPTSGSTPVSVFL